MDRNVEKQDEEERKRKKRERESERKRKKEKESAEEKVRHFLSLASSADNASARRSTRVALP